MEKKTCAAAVLLIVLFPILSLSSVNAASPDLASKTIFIMPDGSVQGTDLIQRNGNVYTLTSSLNSSVGSEAGAQIIIRCSNSVLDGAGKNLNGPGYGVAVCIERALSNVTVQNLKIRGYSCGITFGKVYPFHNGNWDYYHLAPISNVKILNNNIEVSGDAISFSTSSKGWSIYLTDARDTLISGNTLRSLDDIQSGIHHGQGATSTLNDNTFVGCTVYLSDNSKIGGKNNTIDRKPLVCLRGEYDKTVEGAEVVFLCDCNDITVTNVHPSADWGSSIVLVNTMSSTISDCSGHIYLRESNKNILTDDTPFSIQLYNSSFNQIVNNQLTACHFCPSNEPYPGDSAVQLYGVSTNNSISANTFTNNSCAIKFGGYSGDVAANNEVYCNNFVNDSDGVISNNPQNSIYNNKFCGCLTAISIYSSSNKIYQNTIQSCHTALSVMDNANTVFKNQILNCSLGLSIWGAQDTVIYNNDFINNKQQVSILDQYLFDSNIIIAYASNNIFSFGSSGGNYWSDYNGSDSNRDGFGDTPYYVYGNITDSHPLIQPLGSEKEQDFSLVFVLGSVILAVVVSIGLIFYIKKRRH
jgi:parallel beta-helix repeat protein